MKILEGSKYLPLSTRYKREHGRIRRSDWGDEVKVGAFREKHCAGDIPRSGTSLGFSNSDDGERSWNV